MCLWAMGPALLWLCPPMIKRDYEFAKKYQLPIKEVISGGDISVEAYEGDGQLINSDFLDGLSVQKAKEKIVDWLSGA